MKTLIVFYSYTGHTAAYARNLAARESADITEIKDARRPGKLKTFLVGCPLAIRGKGWPISRDDKDPAAYERIIVLSPIWASSPPPAINTFLQTLPANKTIVFKANSSSGKSECRDRVEAVIKSRGSRMESFEDLKVGG